MPFSRKLRGDVLQAFHVLLRGDGHLVVAFAPLAGDAPRIGRREIVMVTEFHQANLCPLSFQMAKKGLGIGNGGYEQHFAARAVRLRKGLALGGKSGLQGGITDSAVEQLLTGIHHERRASVAIALRHYNGLRPAGS